MTEAGEGTYVQRYELIESVSQPMRHVEALAAAYDSKVQLLHEDNRHGLRARGWLTARVHIQGLLFRRFYLHPSGYLIEGGRGGARVFDGQEEPFFRNPRWVLDWPVIRCKSIALAADVVEGLAKS